MVVQHAISLTDNRNIFIDCMVGVNPHTSQGMVVSVQTLLQICIIPHKAVIQYVQILLRPKGKFQRIITAIKRDSISCILVQCRIDKSIIVPAHFLERKIMNKSIGYLMYNSEINRLLLPVHNWKFKFQSGKFRLLALCRYNIPIINCFL